MAASLYKIYSNENAHNIKMLYNVCLCLEKLSLCYIFSSDVLPLSGAKCLCFETMES